MNMIDVAQPTSILGLRVGTYDLMSGRTQASKTGIIVLSCTKTIQYR